VPTLDQVHHVLATMPAGTDIEMRNRALIALALLTGARGAMRSPRLKLKHVDLEQGCVHQDARDVKTKGSKTFTTWFYPVGGDALPICTEWCEHLRKTLLWGEDDPLFPKTLIGLGDEGGFCAAGLSREHWSGTGPIRTIFKQAFDAAGLRYYNPHCFRDALTQLGERICKTPEEFKAWSQNVGHERVLTTFMSYGKVSNTRQAELIRGMGQGIGNNSRDHIGVLFTEFLRINGHLF
jgi:integrase